jgi:hypothetical protein
MSHHQSAAYFSPVGRDTRAIVSRGAGSPTAISLVINRVESRP